MKPRRSLRWAAAALLGAAALALAGEFALRVAFPGQAFDRYEAAPAAIRHLKLSDDPRLLFEPSSPINPATRSRVFAFDGEINERGFRDAPWREKTGRRKIVVLGDWVTWGRDVPFEETFARRLEALLNEGRTGAASVHNAGVPGYGTCQESALLQNRLAALSSGTVVLAYCLNDRSEHVEVRPHEGGWLVFRRPPAFTTPFSGPLNHRLLERSWLYAWLNGRAGSWPRAAGAFRYEDRDANPALGCLDELAAFVRASGGDFRVAVFPDLSDDAAVRRFFDREREAVLARCRAGGIPALDLEPVLREAAGGDLSRWRLGPSDHTHFNAAAQPVIARALRDFLEARKP